MGLGGSLVICKTVYLAAMTRLLPATLSQQAHLHVVGPPSSGKSYEVDAALAHLPETAVVTFDGASPRALIYYDGEIRHRVLLYSEMDGLPMGGDEGDVSNVALSYLRTLCSTGRARYSVVQKRKDGGMSTVHYEREGPAVVIVTGTKSLPDEQLRSRVHEVEVRVDRARVAAVLNAQGSSLAGRQRAKVNPAIVAAQEYLQSLAPVDVHIPFAPELARLLFDRVRVADPRLSRELSRVAGFTAAHALLCIERRRRGPGGAVLAELEDYAAARDVVRELSTTREYTSAAIEVWEAVEAIHKQTSKPVTVDDVKRQLLKASSGIRKSIGELLAGGALLDRRERRGSNVPHLVVPGTGRPGQIALPSAEELSSLPIGEPSSDKAQPSATHEDRSPLRHLRSPWRPNPRTGQDLTPVTSNSGEVPSGQTPCDPAVWRYGGRDYRAGDRLEDGRVVLSVDAGCPTLTKYPAPLPGRSREPGEDDE